MKATTSIPPFRIPCSVPMSTCVIGCGSGGARIGWHLKQRLEAENERIPGSVVFLNLDADERPPYLDDAEFRRIGPCREEGIGTDPRNGKLDLERYKFEMTESVSSVTNALFESDSADAALHARTGMQYVLVGTCGGVGTLCTGPLVNEILLPAAKRRGAKNVRIQVFVVGPTITANASDRTVPLEYRRMIYSNFAETMLELYRHIAAFTPDQEEKVFSVCVLDQHNVHSSFGPMGDFERHYGDCLYMRLFTPAGAYINSRFADHRGMKLFHGRAKAIHELDVDALHQLTKEVPDHERP